MRKSRPCGITGRVSSRSYLLGTGYQFTRKLSHLSCGVSAAAFGIIKRKDSALGDGRLGRAQLPEDTMHSWKEGSGGDKRHISGCVVRLDAVRRQLH